MLLRLLLYVLVKKQWPNGMFYNPHGVKRSGLKGGNEGELYRKNLENKTDIKEESIAIINARKS